MADVVVTGITCLSENKVCRDGLENMAAHGKQRAEISANTDVLILSVFTTNNTL